MKKIKVVELFSGVGGFRIGLEGWKGKSATSSYKKNFDSNFETVWYNQWEPSTKTQHATIIYKSRFDEYPGSDDDIEKVIRENFDSIPKHDLLVGGFPCQDYSVARTLSHAKGLAGTKGVLWWSIHAILREMGKDAPSYLMLENVDRLLKSPANQRGRDFAIMLESLNELGYAVEWRVINAADYGFPQRRRRVYILGYKKGTKLYDAIRNCKDKSDFMTRDGVIAHAFPASKNNLLAIPIHLKGSLEDITESFSSHSPKISPFLNAGVMIDGVVSTMKVSPKYSGTKIVLSDILQTEAEIPEEYYISKEEMAVWKKHKDAKKEHRTTKDGFTYQYSEGGMVFPDALNNASRTIVTGEGGRSPSRFKHVVEVRKGKPRRLTPLELERLNMFPDNHTKFAGVGDTKRAFIMGNALVVGVIEGLGRALQRKI